MVDPVKVCALKMLNVRNHEAKPEFRQKMHSNFVKNLRGTLGQWNHFHKAFHQSPVFLQ